MGSSHTVASLTEQEISSLSKILQHGNDWQALTCYQHTLCTTVASPKQNFKKDCCFIANLSLKILSVVNKILLQ